MKNIKEINDVVANYFEKNPTIQEVRAKDLMDEFIKHGIFDKDHRNGLPIRNELRKLDKKNELSKIPSVFPYRKAKNTNWYFRRDNITDN